MTGLQFVTKAARGRGIESEPKSMAQPKTILMIDDDVNLVNVFRLVFEKVGYQFHSAGSAAEGLDAIERVVPDLIILDVIMEDFVAGFRVVSELRADPRGRYARFAGIPIVMLTSVTTKTQIDFAERVGTALLPVDVLVEKPVKPSDMLAIVESALGRSAGQADNA